MFSDAPFLFLGGLVSTNNFSMTLTTYLSVTNGLQTAMCPTIVIRGFGDRKL